MRRDDLIALQPDPNDRDLRSPVWLERDQMRECSALEYSSSSIGNRRHGVNLPPEFPATIRIRASRRAE